MPRYLFAKYPEFPRLRACRQVDAELSCGYLPAGFQCPSESKCVRGMHAREPVFYHALYRLVIGRLMRSLISMWHVACMNHDALRRSVNAVFHDR